MNAYPPDFQSWPLEKKNAFFAAEAAAYRETKGNGAADHAKPYSSGFGSSQGTRFSENEWPEPKPLPDGLLPVAAFGPAFLPELIAPWAMDISDRMQCPPDFVAIPAMIALGAVIGRTVAIRPQRQTDWYEVPNLWGCIVGRPGGDEIARHGRSVKAPTSS